MESNEEGWEFRTVHTVGLLAGALGDGSHQNPNGEREKLEALDQRRIVRFAVRTMRKGRCSCYTNY